MNKSQIEQELNLLQLEGQALSLNQQKMLRAVGEKYQVAEKEIHREKDDVLKGLKKTLDEKSEQMQKLQAEVTGLSGRYTDAVAEASEKINSSQLKQLAEQNKISDDYLEAIVLNSEKQRVLYVQLQALQTHATS